MRFERHCVEKPWGRNILPPPFDTAVALAGLGDKRIGEIWFEPHGSPAALPLLVKYIFTSEKLSIQVHPNDGQASARGHVSGKNECWYILDAEPGATVGLGTVRPLDDAALKDAVLDGSIEQLMHWRPVSAGEFYPIPAGTVHAIGAGISLVEFQQNADLTYRLYDYGRPRELHLDDGLAVSVAAPYASDQIRRIDPASEAEQELVCFPQFQVVYSRDIQATRAQQADAALWIVPLAGEIVVGEENAQPGGCLYLAPEMAIGRISDGFAALVAIAG